MVQRNGDHRVGSLERGGTLAKSGNELILEDLFEEVTQRLVHNERQTEDYTRVIKKMTGLFRSEIRHIVNQEQDQVNIIVLDKLWLLCVILIERVIAAERSAQDQRLRDLAVEAEEKRRKAEGLNEDVMSRWHRAETGYTENVAKLQAEVDRLKKDNVSRMHESMIEGTVSGAGGEPEKEQSKETCQSGYGRAGGEGGSGGCHGGYRDCH